ncbi:DM13 domain-containing protein [Pseudonocardia acidicola]|uniref:DM13 domain-containing protein n=1 Tax=Pseudonocardia acidicola TaxID=2724939 RepID=A0ABX1S924_9PSEU|nr:DM13 domain-containing protein [Pseudonocardia acidicola]NMH96754.1 DM13 domain-containing protein [Pseudonocardia acidicola]
MERTARHPLLRRPAVHLGFVVGVVLVVVAVWWFQPWKLFVDQVVEEPVPVAAIPGDGPQVMPAVLAGGELISHEHATSGTVQILRLTDGSRVLRLENLVTSNGPQLEVWLTDAPVLPGRDGWYLFEDARHVDLGDLKGNVGSSNYPIPADADLPTLTSVSIWCGRFDVSFGAAALRPTAI